MLSEEESTIQESRFGNSLADRMWKNRHSESSLENQGSTDLDLASEARPEIYDRVDHVLNGLHSLLPNQMSGTGPVGMLTEIMRGMRRDISLVPEDQVREFMRSIGEACLWIADGSMEDLIDSEGEDYEEEDDAGIRGNSAEEG